MAQGIKKIAIIGAGYMAKEHAKAVSLSPALSLAGIMSRTRERAHSIADEFSISLVAQSIKELYEKTEADAVIVAVPELAAKDVILEVFNYPWISLLEKPPGYLPRIAEELNAEADRLCRKSFVALNRRFYGSTTSALKLLENSTSNRSIIIQDQEDQNMALSIGQPKEVVDAWMYANSIHIIDYATVFGRGTIEEVQTIQPFTPYQPCIVESIIKFSSGDTATYIALWQKPGPWGVQICTEQARLEMRPLEQLGVQNKGDRHLTISPPDEWDQQCKPGIRGLVEELGKVLREEDHRLPTLSEGIKVMKLIQRIFEH